MHLVSSKNSMKADPKLTIPEFFSGQCILITGGTGFIGKVLIEKLLRDCPDVKTMYLIIRSKKNKSAIERWSTITQDPLFDLLKKEQPQGLGKIVVFNGDISKKDLGLSSQDKKVLESSVTLIFHAAASVRFDDSLRTALLLNTFGTYEVVQLAKNTPLLQGLVYVSTTYSNSHLKNTVIEEKIYESEYAYEDLLKLLSTSDQKNLEFLRNKILCTHPNTYTFSKSLAEQIINDVRKDLPVIITRPSVVCNSLLGPVPGWTDNMNGIHMISVGYLKGIIRIILGNENGYLDYTPVDYTANGIIVATWYNIVNDKCKSDELPIYNIAYASVVAITFKELLYNGLKHGKTKPYKDTYWYPFAIMTTSTLLFNIYFWILQILPAMIADVYLWLKGKKPMALKLTRKLYRLNIEVLKKFAFDIYNFKDYNFKTLSSEIKSTTDKDIFYLKLHINDVEHAIEVIHNGMRRYLFQENDSDLKQGKIRMKRLYWIHRAVQATLCSSVVYFMWTIGLPLLTSVFL